MSQAEESIVESILGQWHRRKWLIVGIFIAFFSLFASLIIPLPSLYRSSTTILFGEGNISSAIVKSGANNELEMRLGVIQQAVLSRTQLQEVIEHFDLYPSLRNATSPEIMIDQMRKDITIQKRTSAQPQWGQNSTYAITISYQGWDADTVATVTNELADRFRAENERLRTNQASSTTRFIRQELEDARLEFIQQEMRITAFRNEHIGNLPEQQQMNLATLERLSADLRLNRERQLQILKERSAMVASDSESSKLSGPIRLRKMKAELAVMRTNYRDTYPGIIRLKNDIRTLSTELGVNPDTLDDEYKNGNTVDDSDRELTALKSEERRLNNTIFSIMQRIEVAPKVEQQLKQFMYDYEIAKERYLALQKKHQEAQLAESLEVKQNQQIRVIEAAIPAAFPSAPNKPALLFVSLIIGIAIAGNAAFMAEQTKPTFHSLSGVRQFTSVPVLASINTISTPMDKLELLLRKTLISAFFLIIVGIYSALAYKIGENSHSLVWILAG